MLVDHISDNVSKQLARLLMNTQLYIVTENNTISNYKVLLKGLQFIHEFWGLVDDHTTNGLAIKNITCLS